MIASPLTTSIESRQQTRRLRVALADAAGARRGLRHLGGARPDRGPDRPGAARPRRRQGSGAAGGLPAGAVVSGAHGGNHPHRHRLNPADRRARSSGTRGSTRRRSSVSTCTPGIEDTLVILSHQLKYGENGVNVKRSFGSLPPISAYVGELNQVWTNLIHNAIQAMDGRGEIVIETKAEDGVVLVVDSGQRTGNPARGRGPHLRAVLHHQGEGRGDRARAGDLRQHRREARRHHPRRQPARLHPLRGSSAGRRPGTRRRRRHPGRGMASGRGRESTN